MSRRWPVLSDFRAAARDYGREVEIEAARLIREQGVPPYDAILKAQRAIARRRAREHQPERPHEPTR